MRLALEIYLYSIHYPVGIVNKPKVQITLWANLPIIDLKLE